MAQLRNVRTHAGHTIKLVVKPDGFPDVEIGRGQGLTARRGFGTQGVYEIGSIYPREHVPLRFEGTVTLDRFLTRKDVGPQTAASLKDHGIAATGTGDSDVIDGYPGGDIMALPLITIRVEDKFLGDVIRTYEDCTIVDYSETFRANAIAGENATFTYLRSS